MSGQEDGNDIFITQTPLEEDSNNSTNILNSTQMVENLYLDMLEDSEKGREPVYCPQVEDISLSDNELSQAVSDIENRFCQPVSDDVMADMSRKR